jgi:hypothetical protein
MRIFLIADERRPSAWLRPLTGMHTQGETFIEDRGHP